MIIWFLFLNLLIWCITLIDLHILKNPYITRINPTWSWCMIFFFFKNMVFLSVFLINLFIYFWLCWVFVSVQGLSLVAASRGHSSSWCAGLSLPRPLLLWSTGSTPAGSVIEAHRPSCSTACGIFPDQGSDLCPLHWQADSQPLHHQGSPCMILLMCYWILFASILLRIFASIFISDIGL